RSAPPASREVGSRTSGSLSLRSDGNLSRPGIAHRAVLFFLPANPHGAALVADDGGATVALARSTVVSLPVWFAGGDPYLLDCTLLPLDTTTPILPVPGSSRHRLAALRQCHLVLAHSGSL